MHQITHPLSKGPPSFAVSTTTDTISHIDGDVPIDLAIDD